MAAAANASTPFPAAGDALSWRPKPPLSRPIANAELYTDCVNVCAHKLPAGAPVRRRQALRVWLRTARLIKSPRGHCGAVATVGAYGEGTCNRDGNRSGATLEVDAQFRWDNPSESIGIHRGPRVSHFPLTL